MDMHRHASLACVSLWDEPFVTWRGIEVSFNSCEWDVGQHVACVPPVFLTVIVDRGRGAALGARVRVFPAQEWAC